MLEQDSVHLVNARELCRDANEIAPTRAARVVVVGTGTGGGDDRVCSPSLGPLRPDRSYQSKTKRLPKRTLTDGCNGDFIVITARP
jgi:hypothetical protein